MQQKQIDIIPLNKKVLITSILIVGLIPTVFGILSALVLDTWPVYCGYLIPSAIFSLIITASLFLANIFISRRTYARYPDSMSAVRRIITCLLLGLVISNIIIYVEWQIYNALISHLDTEQNRKVIFNNQVLATVLTTMVILVFEIRHYLIQWKTSAVEAERLQKENSQAQLESLRSQVSPHFLFNSLNALQSLIDTDPAKAKEFTQELSKVYRYVLEHKDDMVVTVREELDFIHSFIYLNRIRFGENLQFSTHIDAISLNKYIPPLTLQILIENAIKHNIISTDKPLHISVKDNADHLIVQNDLQLRTEKIESTGIGLKNLKERYKLIYNTEPTFTVVNAQYIASVPLMENDS